MQHSRSFSRLAGLGLAAAVAAGVPAAAEATTWSVPRAASAVAAERRAATSSRTR